MITRSLSVSKSTYLVAFLISVFAGVAAARIDASLFLIAGCLCLVFFVVSLLRLEWGIYALLIVSLLSTFTVRMGHFTVRPDQVVSLILAVALFGFLVSGKRPVVTTALDWLIFAYLMCNVVSSLVHAPDLPTSLQRCLMLAITFSAYFVGTQLIRTPEVLSRLVWLLIIAGALEGLYGILSVYLLTKGVHIGGAHFSVGDIYATGTLLEGNIFGSFEMMIGLLLTGLLLSGNFKNGKLLLLIALLVVLVASLMSFTRAAWLGFLMGSLSFVIFNLKRLILGIRNRLPLILLAFFLLCSVGYLVSVSIKKDSVSLFDVYMDRAHKILEYSSGTGSERLQVWKSAIRLWRLNPILGNGTDSIKVLAKGSSMPMFGSGYWIPNSLILALHDTGVVGLLVFCAIQIVFLWNVRAAMRRTSSSYYQAILEGFFAAFVGVQFAYFFTSAFWLIFIWVFMAIGICACRIAVESSVQKRHP